MRRLLVAFGLLLSIAQARADTITIMLSGSSLSGLAGNPSMTYTLTDADLTNLINWATITFSSCIQKNFGTTTPTNPQALQCWIGTFLYDNTVNSIQSFMTQSPSQIGLTPGAGAAPH